MNTVRIGIFLLEDDPDAAYVLNVFLTNSGLEKLKVFTDPKLFLEEVSEDVLIAVIDHYLGEHITGFEVMQQLLKYNNQCSVIVMSAQRNLEIVAEYQERGSSAYITKNSKDFHQKLLKAINKEKARIERIFGILTRARNKLQGHD